MLRLRGKGAPASGQGEAGDALVEILINPHPFFVRNGHNIHIDLPVTIGEAVLGGKVKVPTPSGAVMVTVRKGSNCGTIMRLKGKGVPHDGGRGDEMITLRIVLPNGSDAALETFLTNWTPGPDYDPRRDMQ